MHIFVTGAGQIARGLIAEILDRGDTATVLRRSAPAVPGARTITADAADPDAVMRAAEGADAICHCVHAAYDPVTWRRELPGPERAAMDAAASLGIPVVFPESVYAFGRGAHDLREHPAVSPCTPLGDVRAELLATRAAHPARTLSVVAGDLIGPTATAQGSIPTASVIAPVRAGRTAWVIGDPDVPHAMTAIPDLARAMLRAAGGADRFAPTGDAVLLAPSASPSLRELAETTAQEAGTGRARIRRVPFWPLASGGALSPTLRSLHQQRYLWEEPTAIHAETLTY